MPVSFTLEKNNVVYSVKKHNCKIWFRGVETLNSTLDNPMELIQYIRPRVGPTWDPWETTVFPWAENVMYTRSKSYVCVSLYVWAWIPWHAHVWERFTKKNRGHVQNKSLGCASFHLIGMVWARKSYFAWVTEKYFSEKVCYFEPQCVFNLLVVLVFVCMGGGVSISVWRVTVCLITRRMNLPKLW